MIGDPAVTVLGVDAEGRESPVLEGGAWRGRRRPRPPRQRRSNGRRQACGAIRSCIAFGPHEPGA